MVSQDREATESKIISLLVSGRRCRERAISLLAAFVIISSCYDAGTSSSSHNAQSWHLPWCRSRLPRAPKNSAKMRYSAIVSCANSSKTD